MPLTIATWNINSVRLRAPMVIDFLHRFKPDILCLQEIKCMNDQFPTKEFSAAGYPHQAINGQKAYHGVATISSLPLNDISSKQFCNIDHARHISASVEYAGKSLNVHNFYVPAGGDVADPESNPKFEHKLGFLDEMHQWFKQSEFDSSQVIVGDFNIAPHANDVWSHKQLLKVVSHTPIETEKLDQMLIDGNWVDLVRKHIPVEEKLFSWWSYRARDWQSTNKGRRLDHIWSTKDIAQNSLGAQIIKEARGWGEKPSDHAPAIIQLA